MFKKVKVIKPLRINQHILEVGDIFDVAEVREEDTSKLGGIFFRPANVKGMPKGCYWLFTDKTFKVLA
jgi:hypothetical protein